MVKSHKCPKFMYFALSIFIKAPYIIVIKLMNTKLESNTKKIILAHQTIVHSNIHMNCIDQSYNLLIDYNHNC